MGIVQSVGFTGTRTGMTGPQLTLVRSWVEALLMEMVCIYHHGCCVGADAQFHWIIRDVAPWARIEGHPSTLASYTDEAVKQRCDVVHAPLTPLKRNQVIVNACPIMLATPREMEEPLRQRGGGTWATIRYVRHARLPHRLLLLYPDGSLIDKTFGG